MGKCLPRIILILEAHGVHPYVKLHNFTIIGNTNNIKTLRMLDCWRSILGLFGRLLESNTPLVHHWSYFQIELRMKFPPAISDHTIPLQKSTGLATAKITLGQGWLCVCVLLAVLSNPMRPNQDRLVGLDQFTPRGPWTSPWIGPLGRFHPEPVNLIFRVIYTFSFIFPFSLCFFPKWQVGESMGWGLI